MSDARPPYLSRAEGLPRFSFFRAQEAQSSSVSSFGLTGSELLTAGFRAACGPGWMITAVSIARARFATEETFKWAMQRKAFSTW